MFCFFPTLLGNKICHPKNVSFWNADYFKLKTIKTQKNQNLRKKLWPSPQLPKGTERADLLQEGSISMDNLVWTTCADGKEHSKVCLLKFLSMSHYLCPANIYLPNYQTFAFPPPCQLPSSPLRFQTILPNTFFCLQLKQVFTARVSAIWVSYWDCWVSQTYPCYKLLCDFLLWTCLVSI